MPQFQLDVPSYRRLLADWFRSLAQEVGWDLSQFGSSGDRYTFGELGTDGVIAEFTESRPFLRFKPEDDRRECEVRELVNRAVKRIEQLDLGGVVWYSADLKEVSLDLTEASRLGTLLERLGGQVPIVGWRRLGTDVLLEFQEDPAEMPEKSDRLLLSPALVHAHVVAPGPIHGHFSSHISHQVMELVAAICGFALGRPVHLPHALFPSDDEDVEGLNERRTDRDILTLARQSVSLDIFRFARVEGGGELFERVRSALLTFDGAMRQGHDAVATLLYVVAAESLMTPNTPWKKKRATARFRWFLEDDLIRERLNTTVNQESFERLFGIRRGSRTQSSLRRRLLERLYAYRSNWVHEGLDPNYQPFGVGFGPEISNRRSGVRDLVETAIVRFLSVPRSSLIGHPEIWPGESCTG